MANLSGGEIYKYPFRVEVFIQKYETKNPFTLVSGKNVVLVKDNSIIKALKEQKAVSTLDLLGVDGNTYKFKDILKSGEFGGKGAGGSTIKEDRELMSLRNRLEEIKKETKSATVPIKIGNNTYHAEGTESTPGTPKSDFHLLDRDGKEIVWISHKDGRNPKDFQQWGGISQRKEPKIFNHPETQKFINDLKEMYPDGLPRATSLYRKIKDKKLKMLSVYGNEYGGRLSRQNCTILIQGPVNLVKKNKVCVFESNHIHVNGESVDSGGFEPVFMAIYKGDRSDAGVKGTRIVIMPIEGRKAKQFTKDRMVI
jgi:hypothetical protein